MKTRIPSEVSPVKRGFTLIELLVVIAIIAILAAILFPVFARARSKARQAACQSNLKQLALAVMMYCQDYDGKFPPVYDDGSGTRYIWADKIFPYVKNEDLFQCPAVSRPINGNLQRTLYQMPMMHVFPEGWWHPVSEEEFTHPATTVMILESYNCWWQHYCPRHNIGHTATTSDGQLYIVGVLNEITWPRHNGGCNVAWVDGHVKWMHIRDLARSDVEYWDRW